MSQGAANHHAANKCEQGKSDPGGDLAQHLSRARAEYIADDLHRDFRTGECAPQPQPRIERELHDADSNRDRQYVQSNGNRYAENLEGQNQVMGN